MKKKNLIYMAIGLVSALLLIRNFSSESNRDRDEVITATEKAESNSNKKVAKSKNLLSRKVINRRPAQAGTKGLKGFSEKDRRSHQRSLFKSQVFAAVATSTNFNSNSGRRAASISKTLKGVKKEDYQVSMGEIISSTPTFNLVKVDPDNVDQKVMKDVVINPTTQRVNIRTGRISMKLENGMNVQNVIAGFPVSIFYEAPAINRYILNVDESVQINEVIDQLKINPKVRSIGAELFAEKPDKNQRQVVEY